jgi:hypothetical protein
MELVVLVTVSTQREGERLMVFDSKVLGQYLDTGEKK